MFQGVGGHLRNHGRFCLYGPFNEDGAYTAPGNEAFDRQLRMRDADMGLRDIEQLDKLALKHNLVLRKRYAMPANNQLLVFLKLEE